MITGVLEKNEMQSIADKYGLPGHFSKPFNVKALLTAVSNALAAPE